MHSFSNGQSTKSEGIFGITAAGFLIMPNATFLLPNRLPEHWTKQTTVLPQL